MTLIRMKSNVAGPAFIANEGSVIDLDDAIAAGLVDGGYAEIVGAAARPAVDVAAEVVEEAAPVETSDLAPAEVAVAPPARTKPKPKPKPKPAN